MEEEQTSQSKWMAYWILSSEFIRENDFVFALIFAKVNETLNELISWVDDFLHYFNTKLTYLGWEVYLILFYFFSDTGVGWEFEPDSPI